MVVNLKKLLVCLSLLVPFILVAACGNNPGPQRSAIVEYLKAFNQIDNDLADTYSGVIDSIASWASCQVPPAGGIAQIAAAFEGGQKKLLALNVPDIPEVRAQYESSQRILALEITSLRGMEAGLNTANQTAYAQAYNSFLEANQQAREVHQAIESLMEKYKITDTEVNYRFRGK